MPTKPTKATKKARLLVMCRLRLDSNCERGRSVAHAVEGGWTKSSWHQQMCAPQEHLTLHKHPLPEPSRYIRIYICYFNSRIFVDEALRFSRFVTRIASSRPREQLSGTLAKVPVRMTSKSGRQTTLTLPNGRICKDAALLVPA